MYVKIKKMEDYAKIPTYGTPDSNGADLYYCGGNRTLHPGERALFDTGIALEFPKGLFAFVTPRSGLAIKYGITVLNAPGLIDTDYRNSIQVILYNSSDDEHTIMNGDRIAQLVFMRSDVISDNPIRFEEVDTLVETVRNLDGFGSTGR